MPAKVDIAVRRALDVDDVAEAIIGADEHIQGSSADGADVIFGDDGRLVAVEALICEMTPQIGEVSDDLMVGPVRAFVFDGNRGAGDASAVADVAVFGTDDETALFVRHLHLNEFGVADRADVAVDHGLHFGGREGMVGVEDNGKRDVLDDGGHSSISGMSAQASVIWRSIRYDSMTACGSGWS